MNVTQCGKCSSGNADQARGREERVRISALGGKKLERLPREALIQAKLGKLAFLPALTVHEALCSMDAEAFFGLG